MIDFKTIRVSDEVRRRWNERMPRELSSPWLLEFFLGVENRDELLERFAWLAQYGLFQVSREMLWQALGDAAFGAGRNGRDVWDTTYANIAEILDEIDRVWGDGLKVWNRSYMPEVLWLVRGWQLRGGMNAWVEVMNTPAVRHARSDTVNRWLQEAGFRDFCRAYAGWIIAYGGEVGRRVISITLDVDGHLDGLDHRAQRWGLEDMRTWSRVFEFLSDEEFSLVAGGNMEKFVEWVVDWTLLDRLDPERIVNVLLVSSEARVRLLGDRVGRFLGTLSPPLQARVLAQGLPSLRQLVFGGLGKQRREALEVEA